MVIRNSVLKIYFVLFAAILFLPCSCDRYVTGVKHGEAVLSKKLFYKGTFPNSIRSIQVGNFNSSSEKKVIILSQWNCVILDLQTSELIKSVTFKKSVGIRPEVLKVKKDGSLEIMLGGGGFGDVGLVNTYGEFIWKYKQVGTIPNMTTGDLDRDGKLEFYVADYDGVHKLDYSGEEVWKTSKDSWEEDIQIYDLGRDKQPLIVTRGSDGKIRFRDNMGRFVREVTPAIKTYDLKILKWPDTYHILTKTDYEIVIMDLDGKVVFQHKLKEDICKWFVHLLEIIDIRGVPVKLNPDNKQYLAVITRFRAALKEAMLSVFSPEGQLIYQEMLNSTTGISVIGKPDGSESLLVGDGTENVWIYEMKR